MGNLDLKNKKGGEKVKKAIYKIENKINHKIYIGESIHPQKRFLEHIRRKECYRSLIHQAIQKYGKENFDFEIIGWFENWREKEQYYINFYNSKAPNGYNIADGGGGPPILKGEKSPKATITQQLADKIIEQILDWKIPKKKIISDNNITPNIFRHINEGNSWHRENLQYPLRPSEPVLNKYRVLYLQWLCINSEEPLNQLGEKVGWKRSSAKMINQGNNHYDPRFKYPLRANREYNKKIIDQETCIDYLHFGE